MRRLATLLFVLGLTTLVTPLAAQDMAAAKAEVLGVIESFLEGMRAKDSARLASHTDSLTRLTLLRTGPAGTRVMVLTGAQFLAAVTNPDQPALEEPIRNPVVTIDGDLATVWTEYQVRIQGALSHCGYDAFHLARLGGTWKILNVSDTAHQNCGEMWPGSQLLRQ